jgi:hypothetical protein
MEDMSDLVAKYLGPQGAAQPRVKDDCAVLDCHAANRTAKAVRDELDAELGGDPLDWQRLLKRAQ